MILSVGLSEPVVGNLLYKERVPVGLFDRKLQKIGAEI